MQKIQLSIPEPCQQNWNDMSPNEQGRFCSSCSKTVVDFSAMTDAQLILYFENLKNENVCGRVHSDQLDRPIQAMPQSRKKILWYWQYIIAFFFMFGKGQQAKAQGEVKPPTTQQPDTTKESPETVYIIAGGISRRTLPPKTKRIAATLPQYFITDDKQQPIAGASVQLLPQGTWLVSDSNGRINLGLKHKVKSLQVSSVGFEDKTIALKHIPENNIIQLIAKPESLENITVKSIATAKYNGPGFSGALGGLMVGYTIVLDQKDSISDTLSFFNPAVSTYPNPVAKSGTLHLSLSLKKDKQYKILVSDVSGKVLLQQNYIAAAKKTTHSITIPAGWSSGTYFVSAIDEKGKIAGTDKILVQ